MGISMEYASPDIFYSLACFTYIVAGVVCGICRWCHMCHPYDKQPEIFYPARQQVAFFCIAIILQLPYVFCPQDEDLWLYVRSFGIVYYPMCFTLMFHRYFRLGRINRNWHSRLFLLVPLVLLVVMMVLAVFRSADNFNRQLWEYIMCGLSLVLTVDFVREGWWLNRQIDNYHTQNFSNESDFPYAFAKRIIYQPVVCFALMWVMFILNSRGFKMVVDLVMVVWMVRFLCSILHPNRMIHSTEVKKQMELMEDEQFEMMQKKVQKTDLDNVTEDGVIESEASDTKKLVSPEDWEMVKREVLTIVSRRYLEPSLKRVEVIADVKKSTHTLAGDFITEIGFYKLVNAFRIRHYERLVQEATASMSQEMAAEKCGFKNRWALSNARKRMENFDYSLIEEYL